MPYDDPKGNKGGIYEVLILEEAVHYAAQQSEPLFEGLILDNHTAL